MTKYRAIRTTVDGVTFASKREAMRYLFLKARERACEIRNLELQPEFKFSVEGRPVLTRSKRYPNGRQLKMVADFRYIDVKRGCSVWEDSKGFRTKEFIIKKALFEALNPGVYLEEV